MRVRSVLRFSERHEVVFLPGRNRRRRRPLSYELGIVALGSVAGPTDDVWNRSAALWGETFKDDPVMAADVLSLAKAAGIRIKGGLREQTQRSSIARTLMSEEGMVHCGYRIATAERLAFRREISPANAGGWNGRQRLHA